MKKAARSILALLMCAAMLLGLGAAVFAENPIVARGNCGVNGDNVKWTLYSNGHMEITGKGEMMEMSPTLGIKYYPWLDYQKEIKTVNIGQGVENVGSGAFCGCTNLRTVCLPDGLLSIDYSAFYGCTDLVSIILPSSLKILGGREFQDCKSLQSIEIPAGVEELGYMDFHGCSSLVDVKLHNGLKSIEYDVFCDCTSLTCIMIPATVDYIGDCAFANCPIKEFKIGSENKKYKVSDGVIYTKDMSTLVCFPGGRTGSFTIPNGVDELGDDSFGYAKISSITIPDGLKTIGVRAFESSSINTVVFKGDAPETINYQAFYEVKATVYYPGDNSTWTKDKREGYYEAKLSWVGNSKPTIRKQPKDVVVGVGDRASLSLTADDAVSYQWFYRTSPDTAWTKVQSATGKTATYRLTVQERHDGFQYRCRVKGVDETVYSNIVTLTTYVKEPVITVQPKDVTGLAGQTVRFSVSSAVFRASYQWYYRTSAYDEWKPVKNSSGETDTYTLDHVEARHNGYQYRCYVSNTNGSVYSDIVTLTVVTKPKITVQPVSTCVGPNYSARFTVEAEGEGLSYQWYYLKTGETTWRKAQNSSATSANYILEIAANHNCYKYKCVVSNIVGSVESKVATLTIG